SGAVSEWPHLTRYRVPEILSDFRLVLADDLDVVAVGAHSLDERVQVVRRQALGELRGGASSVAGEHGRRLVTLHGRRAAGDAQGAAGRSLELVRLLRIAIQGRELDRVRCLLPAIRGGHGGRAGTEERSNRENRSREL